MKTITTFILLLICCNSCIITDTPGFFSGYKKLSEDQKQQVVFTVENQPICSLPNDKRIYAITASQLLNCMKDNDTSVVYLWSPHCSSEVCITMAIAQYYCDKHNYKLYVIADYYDMERMNQQNTNPTPLFSVNHKHYGTDYAQAYKKRFKKELIKGVDLGKEAQYSRFLFFKKDNAVLAKNNLIKDK